jgi:hypothetical protein
VTPSVLILSCPQDLHAHAACEAIERKGYRALILYTPDFPSRAGLTIVPDGHHSTLTWQATEKWRLGRDFVSVWVRRTFFATTPAEFDERDRLTIERECGEMRRAFLSLLCPRAMWVNPLRCESCKAAQLAAAARLGFQIPPTLVSNNPTEILAFVKRARTEVVFKTFGALVPTTIVTPELLADPELLRWTPGIYQHYVPKAYELRATVIGRRIFAVKINSQETLRGRIDWREAQRRPRGQAGDLTFEAAILPAAVAERCLHLMQVLGLVYGAIDLIVTPALEYVFLEVNPAGQFLWAESETGLPLLDALSTMLIEGRPDYGARLSAPTVRFDQALERAAEARQRHGMQHHVCDLRCR